MLRCFTTLLKSKLPCKSLWPTEKKSGRVFKFQCELFRSMILRVQNVFINSIIMYIFSYQANILFYLKNHKEYFLLVHMKAVFKRNNSF